jgi:hypothetical protein
MPRGLRHFAEQHHNLLVAQVVAKQRTHNHIVARRKRLIDCVVPSERDLCTIPLRPFCGKLDRPLTDVDSMEF